MKYFIPPIQSNLAASPPPIKPIAPPQESFSHILSTELRSFSITPNTSAKATPAVPATTEAPVQNKNMSGRWFVQHLLNGPSPIDMSSDEQKKSEAPAQAANVTPAGSALTPMPNSSPAVKPGVGPKFTEVSAQISKMMTPGIVNLPIQNPSPAVKPDKGQSDMKSGAIDIASIVSIVNFNKPGSKAAPQSGPIKIFGDNPSVVVSSRSQNSQMSHNGWDRYQMDAPSNGKKGGSSFLAGGVVVAFKIAIG